MVENTHPSPYRWAAVGDVNAFFGLMLDNIAGLVLTVSLLSFYFGFPVEFALRYMVPGTALGVLAGDLMYFVLAFWLARKSGRSDVTAMPLGLDTPSTLGMVFFVLGPAYASRLSTGLQEAGWKSLDQLREAIEAGQVSASLLEQFSFDAAQQTWHIGICAIIITGLIKGVLALGSGWIRRVFPGAGLLGSLAAIALVLIAFTQLEKLATAPVVGFASLTIVLVTLVARGRLPWNFPGALGAVCLGCLLWYLMMGFDQVAGTQILPAGQESAAVWLPTEWLTVFRFEWWTAFPETVAYLPYIIPFAIATVVGGIDCTESAASAGDEYSTGTIIGIESAATLVAAFCGGVIQTTPYIGHPAYKAMGGRAAYTLATALFVGGAGIVGYFSLLFQLIPEVAVLPILVFIGVEITAQSFQATEKKHYAAIALACLPALAKLVTIYLGQFLGWLSSAAPEVYAQMPDSLASLSLRLNVLAGGFILTSLIWGSAMARIVDRQFVPAATYLFCGAVMVLFGIMHSPLAGDQMFLPTALFSERFSAEQARCTWGFFVAYLVMGSTLLGLHFLMDPSQDDTPATAD